MYFHLRTFFELLKLYFHVVCLFGFWVIFPFPYFAPKSFCLIHFWLWYAFAHSSPTCWRIFFRCFGMSCFVCVVSSCLGIFLVFLLSSVHFDKTFQIVFLVLAVLFPPRSNICSSSVSVFLLVITVFLPILIRVSIPILTSVGGLQGNPDFFTD